MPRRRNSRGQYMRDRAERKMMRRGRDYGYPMDYAHDNPEHRYMDDARNGRDRYYPERFYMDYERPYESRRTYDYNYDMRGDYRGRDYRRDYRDYRDYADDDYDKEYHEDLAKWTNKLKQYDRFGLSKEQVVQKARDMGVSFNEYEPDEFYAVYLMQVSDYPSIANEPHTYLAMAKSWLEDKDIELEPSEKLCKYMYEIVMADED